MLTRLMTSVPYDKARRIDWASAVAQPLPRGIHCAVPAGRAADTRLVGGTGAYSGAHEIRDALRLVSGPDVALDGYLCWPGHTSDQVHALARRDNPSSKEFVLWLADAAMGPVADFRTRHQFVKDLVRAAGASCLRVAEAIKVRDEGELLWAQRQFLMDGHEGFLLRTGHGPYEPGAESASYMHGRLYASDAFPVVDYRPVGPAYVCSAGDDEYFDVPARHPPGFAEPPPPERCVGKVLRVLFSKRVAGVPQHPVADRFL